MKILKFSTHFAYRNILSINRFKVSNMRGNKPMSIQDFIVNFPTQNNMGSTEQRQMDQAQGKLDQKYQNQPIRRNDNQIGSDFIKLSPLYQLCNPSEQIKKQQVRRFAVRQIDTKVKMQNSITFMKYLGHAVPKAYCCEIIRIIEQYCQKHKNETSLKDIVANPSFSKKIAQIQQKMFHQLRSLMTKTINYIPENSSQNTFFIQSLLECLSKSIPQQIKLMNFEKESFFINFQQKKKINRFYYNNLHSYANQNNDLDIPPKDSRDTVQQQNTNPKKQMLKVSLQKAAKLKNNNKYKGNIIHKPLTGDKKDEIIMPLKIGGDNIVFNALAQKIENRQQIIQQSQRYAYIYGLPFNVSLEQTDELIRYMQQVKFAKVSEYILSPYKQMLEQSINNIIYRIPEDFNPNNKDRWSQRILKIFQSANIEEITSPIGKDVKKKKKYNKKTEKDTIREIILQNVPKNVHHAVTEALLLKIKKQSYSKFNKSSMIVKFATKQDKQKILTTETRLFGINFKKFKNLRMEQGFSKTIIILKGFHWQCTSEQFVKEINSALSPLSIVVKDEENCILTKNYVNIQFQHLTLALQAIKLLNNRQFKNLSMKAHLTYGPCLIYDGKYINDSGNSYDELKKKIEESSHLHSIRYEEEDRNSE